MRRGMRRNPVENLREYLPLQLLEARLGCFNQSNGAGFLRQNTIVIMSEPGVFAFVGESLKIGEPEQFVRSNTQPIGQRSNRLDGWNVPRGGRFDGLHPLRVN